MSGRLKQYANRHQRFYRKLDVGALSCVHAGDVSITFVGRGAQICTNPKLWWRRKPLGKNIGFSQSARNHLETNDIKPTVLQVIRSFKNLPGSKRSSLVAILKKVVVLFGGWLSQVVSYHSKLLIFETFFPRYEKAMIVVSQTETWKTNYWNEGIMTWCW